MKHAGSQAVRPVVGIQHVVACSRLPLRRIAAACRLAMATVAAVAAVVPAAAEPVVWTGFAPVWTARWFNGVSVETREFQYRLDWLGYCNAHAGALCNELSFWGSGGNWDSRLVPTQANEVKLGIGAKVVVGGYDSSFLGQISGFAAAAVLSAGDAAISIHTGSSLNVGKASIGNLALNPGSTFATQGGSTIGNLTQAEGQLSGGSTVVLSIGAPHVDVRLKGHVMQLAQAYAGPLELLMADQSRLVNQQILSGTGRVTCDFCTTYEAIYAPSVFLNLGSIKGPMSISFVRFDNDGVVDLQTGLFTALNSGVHTGEFKGGAASAMVFGSIGAGSLGHQFLRDSSIRSSSRVAFSGSSHRIEGLYDVATTVIGAPYADVTFASASAKLDVISVSAGSNVHFESGGAGLKIGHLHVDTPQSFAFFTGAASTVGRVVLNAGGINTRSGLDIADSFVWRSGALIGPVASANTTLEAGTRDLRGTLTNTGTLAWNDGSFSKWSGVLDNRAGATFALNGDFSIGDASGRIDNAGTLRKVTGSGRAALSPPVHNSGQVEVLAGTLALTGGGSHAGAFTVAPGALLQLSGGHTIGVGASTSGRVDVTGGSFTVLAGASYRNAAGNTLTADAVNAGNLANLAGAAVVASSVDNRAGASFTNAGTFRRNANGVGAVVSNAGSLVNQTNGQMHILSLDNSGSLVNNGEVSVDGGVLRNSGTLDNAGMLTLTHADIRGSIVNTGSVVSRGAFSLDGSASAPASMANTGVLTSYGQFTVGSAGSVTGAGRYVQAGGDTVVDGLLQATGGIDIQNGALSGRGTLVGDVAMGIYSLLAPGNSPGTLTIDGNLSLNGAFYSPGANVQIEIGGAAHYDRLLISGEASFSEAKASLVFVGGYLPNDGDRYTWLTAGRINDAGITTEVSGLPVGWRSVVTNSGTALRLEVLNEPDPPPLSQIANRGSVLIAPATVASNWAGAATDLTALDNAGSFVNLADAVLVTRSLNNQAGATLINHGAMQVACCSGPITNAGIVRNRSGADLDLAAKVSNDGSLFNQGTVTLRAGLANGPGGHVETTGLLNHRFLGDAIVNAGTFVVGGTLQMVGGTFGLNYGTLRNAGGQFTVLAGGRVQGTGSYVQSGGYESSTRVDGTLAASRLRFDEGRLSGSGTLVGPVDLGNVQVAPGNSPGTLTIDGSLTASHTIVEIELAGTALADQLHVTGNATFMGGAVRFLLADGYTPQAGDHFTWLQTDGAVAGLDSLSWGVYTGGADVLQHWNTPTDMRLSFHGGRLEFNAAAVPEPQTWALWLLGLVAGGALVRRRAACAAA